MLRLLLLVLALAFLAYCQSPPYAFTVSVSATFSDVEAPRSTRRMKFCYAPDIPCVEEQEYVPWLVMQCCRFCFGCLLELLRRVMTKVLETGVSCDSFLFSSVDEMLMMDDILV
jgi:hypothetical protein